MKLRIVVAALETLLVAGIGIYWMDHRFFVHPDDDKPFVSTLECGVAVPEASYRLSGPYAHDNLTVFLLRGTETLDAKSFLTLQEAIEQKKAVIHETGSVNKLAIENLAAAEEVNVQSGNIVKGGKQDRTLPYDTVIASKSGQVPIESFCVEQSRWTKRGDESSEKFCSASFSLPTSDIKREAKLSRPSAQSEVWKSVAST